MEGMTQGTPPTVVRIYTRRWCGYCFAAKRLFAGLGVEFEEIPVDRDPELRGEVSATAGNWPTVPMIFIRDQFVGGYTEAAALHRSGKLEALIHPEVAPTNG